VVVAGATADAKLHPHGTGDAGTVPDSAAMMPTGLKDLVMLGSPRS
jgi:hypothetical protein